MVHSRREMTALLACILAGCGGASDVSNESSEATLSSIGAACSIGEDAPSFGGHSVTELTLGSGVSACGGGVCLVASFEGRVSCPYGNDDGECRTPSGEVVTASVPPQLVARPPEDAVYCSCRCDGPDDGNLCECPSGFECRHLIDDQGLLEQELTGSYCVRAGTYVDDPAAIADGPRCDREAGNCEDR